MLRGILDRRWLVVGLSVLFVCGTYCLLPLIGAEFMPKSDNNSFSIEVKMREGTRLERTASTVESIENLIYTLTQDSLCTVYSHIGAGAGSGGDIFAGDNTASLKVILSPDSKYTPEELMEMLFANTAGIEGLELSFMQDRNSLGALMGSEEAPIVIEIKGEELDELTNITGQVSELAKGVPGLFNVSNSIEDGAPEIVITVNRALAGMNNLNVTTIVSQIQEQLSGKSAGQMDYKGEMRDIMIKVPEIPLSQLNDIVITSNSKQFRLAELADVRRDVAPKEIFRRNQSRIAKVTANLEDGYSLNKVSEDIRATLSVIELPANYSINITGEEEKRQDSMGGLMFALLLSVVLVYMVMASQFESLLHPFTILLTDLKSSLLNFSNEYGTREAFTASQKMIARAPMLAITP